MQQKAIYFRGCYDSMDYLKKGRRFITENGGIGEKLLPLLHRLFGVEKAIEICYNKY